MHIRIKLILTFIIYVCLGLLIVSSKSDSLKILPSDSANITQSTSPFQASGNIPEKTPEKVPEYIEITDNNLISYCIGDADNDKINDLIVITKAANQTNGIPGESYGDFLYLLKYDGSVLGNKKVVNRFDLEIHKPLKVMIGEVNNDGLNDITVTVYNLAKFNPVMAKRPYFYNIVNGKLRALWRGTRLSRPFTDYILEDINSDGVDELIASEQMNNGKMTVTSYVWKSFGFTALAQSKPFDKINKISKSENSHAVYIETVQNNINKNVILKYDGKELIQQ